MQNTEPTSAKRFCRHCGAQLSPVAAVCLGCGAAASTPRQQDNSGLKWLIPVGRSGWAIAASYLCLFSILLIPAPIALVVSIIAIIHIQKSKTRETPLLGMGRSIFALVVSAIFTLLLIAIKFS